MTDFGLIPVIFITGILAGIIIWDLRDRRRERLALQKATTEMREALKTLSDTHNNLVTQLKMLGDRVNTHEFALKNKAGQSEAVAGKRFT